MKNKSHCFSCLVLLTLLLYYEGQCSQLCPLKCSCFGDFVDCSKLKLLEIPQDIPHWVETLDLSRNPGLYIPDAAFSNLINLKKLKLDRLNLKHLPNLGPHPSLQNLSLVRNRLERVTSDCLAGLPNLQLLDLSGNRIVSLEYVQIGNLTLETLILSRNRISRIHPHSLDALSSLADLRLSRNFLSDDAIKEVAFANLSELQILDLSRNKFLRLRALLFQSLKTLKTLILSYNSISELPDGVFYGLDRLTDLFLDHNNLSSVSNAWLFGLGSLRTLSLSNNSIEVVKTNAWDSTKHLANLNLNYNRLSSITQLTFHGLSNLQNLHLNHNFLTTIEDHSFRHTKRLSKLDLSFNTLNFCVENDSGSFKGLDSLVYLNLAHIKINTIHKDVFKSLISLSEFDLSQNPIRNLPYNPFSSMNHLQMLKLTSDSLVCDSHFRWFIEWLTKSSVELSQILATCSYPPELNGVPFVNLTNFELTEVFSVMPVIMHSPENQIVLYGSNITLSCVVETAFDETMEFSWLKSGYIIEPFKSKVFSSMLERNITNDTYLQNVTSFLTLVNVTHDDAGKYQCSFRNKYGVQYSVPSIIQVHVFPYFTHTPGNVTAQVNGMVKLTCAADGSPPPEIAWAKDGGHDFPAAKERRMIVMTQEHAFFIKKVNVQDEGVYTCKAKNAAGTAASHVTVTVQQIPEFVKPLEDKSARTGETAVLECSGTGRPSPNITWSKDGQSLPGDKRYVVVKTGFLIILETKMSDAGLYTCHLTNDVGSVKGQIVLSVRTGMQDPSSTTGLIIIIVVFCIAGTSVVWVLIIYQTRKRAQAAMNVTYSKTNGANCSPCLSSHSQIMHTYPPLMTTTTDGQDNGSEHSSGKDSGVADSSQRSSEDLPPVDSPKLTTSHSYLYSDDYSSLSRGVYQLSTKDVSEGGCNTQQTYLTPNTGGYPATINTASLRRGSMSRLASRTHGRNNSSSSGGIAFAPGSSTPTLQRRRGEDSISQIESPYGFITAKPLFLESEKLCHEITDGNSFEEQRNSLNVDSPRVSIASDDGRCSPIYSKSTIEYITHTIAK